MAFFFCTRISSTEAFVSSPILITSRNLAAQSTSPITPVQQYTHPTSDTTSLHYSHTPYNHNYKSNQNNNRRRQQDSNNNNNNNSHEGRRPRGSSSPASSFRQGGSGNHQQRQEARKAWLSEATQRLLATTPGMLYQNGKWHEVTSLFHGWAALAKQDKDAPVRMEALLKRLLQEQEQAALRLQEEKNTQTTSTRAMQMVDIGLYNT